MPLNPIRAVIRAFHRRTPLDWHGVGLLTLTGFSALLIPCTTLAGNGIHINANSNDTQCLSLNDTSTTFTSGSPSAISNFYMRETLVYKDGGSGKCDPAAKGGQTSVLFYRPTELANNVGATSLSLGGELYVNSGRLMLGIPNGSLLIGHVGDIGNLVASGGGIAIGRSVQATAAGSIAMGQTARAVNTRAAAFGNNASATQAYGSAFGSASAASGEAATIFGASSLASGSSSFAGGRFAQPMGASSVSLGYSTIAAEANSVALGFDADVRSAAGIALGDLSRAGDLRTVAPVTLNGTSYNFDSSKVIGPLSIGGVATRTLLNLAPGAVNPTSTDAINGAQLFAEYTSTQQLGDRELIVSRSVADALGTGPMGDGGRVVLAPLSLVSLAPGVAQPTSLLGALKALDRSHADTDQRLGRMFDSAFSTAQDFAQLNVNGRMRWNAETEAYDASHGDSALNKIIHVAAGEANLDAINKGQLDVAEGHARDAGQAAGAAATLALKARDSAGETEAATRQVQATAAQAERAAAQARQAADTAQTTANAASDSAGKAQATATAAQGNADAAEAAVVQARQTTERAQRDADLASQQAIQADQTATAVQERGARIADAAEQARSQAQTASQQASAAQEAASQARDGAELAQRNAVASEQTAAGAQTAVADARRSADSALQAGHDVQVAAQTAQTTASAAQSSAASAKAAADRANATGNDAAAVAAGAETAARGAQRNADTALNDASVAQTSASGALATLDTAQASLSTAREAAEGAQKVGDKAAASSEIAQQRAQTAQSSAAAAQAAATDVLNAAQNTQTHADEALAVAKAARQVADSAQDAATAVLSSSGAVQQATEAAQARAGRAQDSAAEAQRAAGVAQTTANQADTAAVEARQAADAAQVTADRAAATASNALRDAGEAAQTADRASNIGTGAQRTAESAERAAQVATDASATAHQAANAALTTGQTAQQLATQVQRTADAGMASAAGALDAAQQARDAAALAQGTAASAVTAAGNARKTADAAQATADSAQANANLAGEHASAAQGTADRAWGVAGVAQHAAESAQGTADSARVRADLSANQLKGLGADETVVGRIDSAVRNATGTASDFLSQVLGGGAGTDVDGKPLAPSYGIATLADYAGATRSSHNNVGDALNHLDGNLNTLNTAVQAQDKGLDEVQAKALGQRNDSLLWDEAKGYYTAGRGTQRDAPARIGNLADGLAPTDAVNKHQLEGVQGIVESAEDLAGEARDRAAIAGETGGKAQDVAARVQLAADTARQSADIAGASASATQQTAEGIQQGAEQTGQVARRASGQLQGLAEGESVLDRLQDAARVGTQALANTLGAGATAGTDATLLAPSFVLNTRGMATGVVGEALEGLDSGVAKADEQAEQAGTNVGSLRAQADEGQVGLMRQNATRGEIQVGRDAEGTRVALNGSQGPRTLGGIQEGALSAQSSDAVTGRQLNAVKQRVERLDQQRSGVAVDKRGEGSDNAQVTQGSRAVAVGASAGASGQGSVAAGAGAQTQAERATVSGADAKASATNSVAIGTGSQASRANSVAVGSVGRERQITRLRAATQRTDAINLRQATELSNQAAEQSVRQSNAYTDRRVGQLSQDVYAGVAAAMAMAGLPQASSSGKSMLAMAAAVYENQPAVAISLTARSSNGRWTYGTTGTGTARGDYAVTMGVGYHW